ncbi:MAG: hypothetical protein JW912_08455 [Sedimentisphaerales bacterium]|nr:hypothetical protein [Sedimentisphaerales bacterium]
MDRISFFLLFIVSGFLYADLVLPNIFCDNMVLQEQMQINIWGTAAPRQVIKIKPSWQDKITTVLSDANGKWKAKLLTPTASFNSHTLKIISDEETVQFENILIGQVWLCSGQSNMAFHLRSCQTADTEIPSANFPYIRLFQVSCNFSDVPLGDVCGNWVLCTPGSAAYFSAVGYFFGKNLLQFINKPIGLINASWGGTPVEAWMTPDALAPFTEFENSLNKKWTESDSQYPFVKKRYEKQMEEWNHRVKTEPSLSKPPLPNQLRPQNKPFCCYNGMIAPIKDYSIAGVIWYQGEANTPSSSYKYYYDVFPAMIRNWRNIWQQDDFPFIFVQLAASTGYGLGVCHIRQAQMLTLDKVPNTGMAVAMDIGDSTDHHPKNKHDVGYRLSLWALKYLYGNNAIVPSGPLYKSMRIEGNKIRLSFDYCGDGLMAKGGKLTDFAICGPDGMFYPAEAVIDGTNVLVWSEQVSQPKHASFAWCEYAEPNFYNRNNLPASPFNTLELEKNK